MPDTKYHKGDTVKVINAIQYDNGEPFSTYYDEYSVLSTNGRRVVIGVDGVTTAATPTDIPFSGDIEEGSTVRFVGNTDYDGTPIKAWFDEYTVSEKSGDRAVLVHDGELFAAVNVTDCELI